MSSFNPAFSIAAAHGITARTIATWYPQLLRSPRVQVPIHVEALAIRTAGGQWADCTMQAPTKGSTGNTRSSLLPPPFQNLPDGQRGTGVYLHWALPDGLTAGNAGSDTSAPVFPAIPNRWLILRVSNSADNVARRAVTGWILRAGDETPQAIALDSFTEDGKDQGTLLNPLTALGHGDVAWAAYFDNVVNRLAFYDPLTDTPAPQGPLAYLICGWYTDSSLDPLGSNIKSLSDFDSRMAQLGWELAAGELQEATNHSYNYIVAANRLGLQTSEAFNLETAPAVFAAAPALSARLSLATGTFVPPVPYVANIRATPAPVDPTGQPLGGSYTTNGSWWPSLTLYHGSVVAIAWPGTTLPGSDTGLLTGQIGGPPPASQISVAVGNTLAEAMGAMIAKTNNASDAADQARALEAFMSGSLAELDLPDGAARVDARLHADSFGSLPGQETTEDISQPPIPDISSLPTPPSSLDPGIFAGQVSAVPSTTPARAPVTNLVASAVETQAFITPEFLSERTILTGGLLAASGALQKPAPQPGPSQTITVKRTAPRFFFPSDPVFLVQNANRSYKHGYDGRFSEDNKLICRLSGFTTTELSCSDTVSIGGRYAVSGEDVLERGVENGSVPPDCEDLLRELILLDPGSAYAAAQVDVNSDTNLTARIQNLQVEQTAWWATRDMRVDQAPLTAVSGVAGMLPSPVAVTPPVLAWTPLHLDWSIQFVPSTNGVSDWVLDEIDFAPGNQALPAPNDTTSGLTLSGRVHLTAGAPAAIAASVRLALAQAQLAGGAGPLPPNLQIRFNSAVSQILLNNFASLTANASLAPHTAADAGSAIDRSTLADLASSLENMDVLTGALDNFRTKLRAGVAGDGVTTPSGGKVPANFFALRAGFIRILRLRIVDCFGQFVDLAGSSATTIADPNQIITSQPMQVPARSDIVALPPRFTSPARVWFRFQDAAGNKSDADANVSPVCGFVLPNHLDGDLEFFDTAGNNLGDVRPDPQAGIIWEDAPGTPSIVGKTPSDAIPNSFLAGIAQGLITWGFADISLGQGAREDALSALLRIIDSTLWSTDPYAHSGDEHLSLLIGHPVVVMRAVVRVEVSEPVTPADINKMRIPVRLGALTHWQDGLFGYFVNDDYLTLYCADAAVAGFAREVGPGQGFLRPINLVPNFYQTFSDDLASPNQFTYAATPAPNVEKLFSPHAAASQPSAGTLIPIVTGISPGSGVPAGGDTVTITGLNFTGVAAVKFGSTPAASFTFISDSEVTAVSPAGTGTVPITVTTPVGTSASQGTITEGKSPVTTPYVNTSGVVMIPPNQDLNLTLLVEPHCFVHATSGMTPRKEIGMRRDWVASALSRIAPTFRFGPVLCDPARIRMPIPNEIHGTWSWDHRLSITAWSEDKVTNTTGDALIPPDPAKAQEGWLRMNPQNTGSSPGT